jgi:uncharacterized protein YqhQ
LISKVFSTPGIWTQKITTKKPSEEQIIVARIAMANCVKNSEKSSKFDDILSTSKEVTNG